MKNCFLSIIFLNMFVFAQTFSTEFINNLSPEEQEQLNRFYQTNQSNDVENKNFIEMPQETLIDDVATGRAIRKQSLAMIFLAKCLPQLLLRATCPYPMTM